MARRTAFACLLVAVGCFAGACSDDRHVFYSNPYSPKTVMLRDTMARQVIWSKIVPVYHTLTIDLDHPGESMPWKVGKIPATKMSWWLHDEVTKKRISAGKVALGGTPVMLDVDIRDVPEYPAGYIPPVMAIAPLTPPSPQPVVLPDIPKPQPPTVPKEPEPDILDQLLGESEESDEPEESS